LTVCGLTVENPETNGQNQGGKQADAIELRGPAHL